MFGCLEKGLREQGLGREPKTPHVISGQLRLFFLSFAMPSCQHPALALSCSKPLGSISTRMSSAASFPPNSNSRDNALAPLTFRLPRGPASCRLVSKNLISTAHQF
jgi:hypothetical protein